MNLTRKKAIFNLSRLSEICAGQEIKLTPEDIASIRFAKDSLKTDEAYQLEYEKRDVVEVIRCKNCKYFEYDIVAEISGIPLIVGHEMCTKWGNGCKTNKNGYCFLADKRDEEQTDRNDSK